MICVRLSVIYLPVMRIKEVVQLASFNKTAEQIAYEVANVMGVQVHEFEADPT